MRTRPRPLISAGLALLLVTAACSRPFYVGTDGVRVGTDRSVAPGAPEAGRGDGRRAPGLSRRPVAGKEAPGTLIARDGARCLVTAARFAETHVGERVWCGWQAAPR